MNANTEWVVDRCEASGASYPGRVYVTLAPAPTPPATALPKPYFIVHPSQGTDEQTRFSGGSLTERPDYTIHVVGNSASSVETAVANLKAEFVTNGFMVPPTISGRNNFAGYWRMPTPINTDRDVTPWLVYAVIELGWVSEPA